MTTRRKRGRPAHPDILTPAEWKVADAVRHGLTNPQIARAQGTSTDAVKFHVANILGKLGMRSRAELRRWKGIRAGSPMEEKAAMQNGGAIGGIRGIGQVARTVSDIGAARRWYRLVLGIEPLFDAGNLAFFACGGTRLMLTESEDGKGAKEESILYFRVEDLPAEFARLEAAGATVLSAPHRIHTHEDGSEEWMGFIEDNDGRPLGLMATARSEKR